MADPHDGGMILSSLRMPYQAALAQLHARLRVEFPDLHAAHLIVFQLIAHPPAGSRLTDLAAQAQTTKQAMGQLIDALERSGYIERIPDPHDRRAKQIRLTARGWAVHERGGAIVVALQTDWAAALGPGRLAQLLTLLADLRAHLSARILAAS